MFACLTCTASQILLYIIKIETVYWYEALAFGPNNPQILGLMIEDPETFDLLVLRFQRMVFSCLTLTTTSIFAVKICFLLFFYEMVRRLPRLILAWKVIFGITVLLWALCTCALFMKCPQFSRSAGKSAMSPPTKFCSLLTTRRQVFKRYQVHSNSCFSYRHSSSRCSFRFVP